MGTIWLDNNHALAHRSMGIVQYHQKRYKEALISLKKSFKLKPDETDTLISTGGLYIAMGKYKKAIQHWEKAIKAVPNFIEARNNLGVMYEKLEKQEKLSQNMKRY